MGNPLQGGRGKVAVTLPAAPQEVTICNLVEEPEGTQRYQGERFTFPIRPFQIRTFRLHYA